MTIVAAIKGITISPTGIVHYYYKNNCYLVTNPFYAIGCADVLAYGALAYGATAEEAVKIAIERNSYCGGNIDILKLDII
jgi:hypothetical protein